MGDKKIFLIMFIVLILISIGGVWASDDASADDVNAVSDEIAVDIADDVSGQPDASVSDKNLSNVDDEPADVQSVADSKGKNNEVLGASNGEDVLGATALPSSITSSQTLSGDYQIRSTALSYYTTSVSGTNTIINGVNCKIDGLNQKTIFSVT